MLKAKCIVTTQQDWHMPCPNWTLQNHEAPVQLQLLGLLCLSHHPTYLAPLTRPDIIPLGPRIRSRADPV